MFVVIIIETFCVLYIPGNAKIDIMLLTFADYINKAGKTILHTAAEQGKSLKQFFTFYFFEILIV